VYTQNVIWKECKHINFYICEGAGRNYGRVERNAHGERVSWRIPTLDLVFGDRKEERPIMHKMIIQTLPIECWLNLIMIMGWLLKI